MQRKRNLNSDMIISVAATVIEESGYDNFTIRMLADALGVKSPSLYNHFGGLDEVKQMLSLYSIKMLGDAIRDAAVGRASEDAIREIAHAYRNFAKDKKELYKAFTQVKQTQKSNDEAISFANTLYQILQPFALSRDVENKFLMIFRTGIHGFVALENAGVFREANVSDTDIYFEELVEKQILILNSYKAEISARG